MKLLASLISLFLPFALSAGDSLPVAEELVRDLKGSSKSSKSGGSGYSDTVVYTMRARKLVTGGNNSTIITTTGDCKGPGKTQTKCAFQQVDACSGGGDCVTQIALTENRNTGLYFQGASGQNFVPVVGGTGKYVGASGQGSIAGDNKLVFTVQYSTFA